MAAKDKFPNINDYELSWSSVGITINVDDGESLDGLDIASLKFAAKVDTSRIRAQAGGRELSETEGVSTCSGSMTLTVRAMRTLKAAIAKLAPVRDGGVKQLSLVRFDVIALYSTKTNPADVIISKLIGCRLRSDDRDGKEGSDALMVSVDLNPIEVLEEIDGEEMALL